MGTTPSCSSNSVLAADIAGGLAARLDAGLNWDLVDIITRDGDLIGKRPALSDSVLVDVGWRSSPRLALCRAGSFQSVERGTQPSVQPVSVELESHSRAARIVDQVTQPEGGPSLEAAEVIVTGGMGLGGPEKLSLAEDLASVLGGVVGDHACRRVRGMVPSFGADRPDGQDGLTPALRHARRVGSGAAQGRHAKLRDHRRDQYGPPRPIFEFCDLAVVGDVHSIVPQLVELLRRRKGS